MSDKDLAKLLLLNEQEIFNSRREDLELHNIELGTTLEKSALDTRALFEKVAKKFKKERLLDLRGEIESKKEKAFPHSIIEKIKNKKELLESILNTFPEISPSLTFQNRDLNSYSDADVEIALKQLEDLGVLEEYFEKEKKDES